VLVVSGPSAEISFTLSELKALPVTQGQAGIKSSTGQITIPALYSGVALADLLDLMGGLDPEMGVSLVAEDGYAMTLSNDQISQGDFITYDPATGEENHPGDPLTVLIAYEREGQPLDTKGEGTLRMVIVSPKNNQVTDGHWSVKWVNRVEIKPLGAEWSLPMQGVIADEIDRNTYQSCGAPGCHQASWTDDKAQKWDGVPLWLLAGRVDDAIKHDGPAYNEALARAGYLIEIIATDGYSVTLDSQSALRNNDWMVSYLVNGNPLPEGYFPLRLVGKGLEKNQMVGAIAQINLKLDPALATQMAQTAAAPTSTPPAPAATPPPVVEGNLTIFGMVQSPLSLSEEDLRNMKVVQITAEHPKKGPTEYEGVLLNTLLNLAEVLPGASKMLVTASDGYAVELALGDVQSCQECLVAFSETPGLYNLVMPGLDSSAWVKEVVLIEIK
jgi:DMSO/TMAO reductase YedYZ molybdopterin-dependent catalytic subunit